MFKRFLSGLLGVALISMLCGCGVPSVKTSGSDLKDKGAKVTGVDQNQNVSKVATPEVSKAQSVQSVATVTPPISDIGIDTSPVVTQVQEDQKIKGDSKSDSQKPVVVKLKSS